nr:uncharacterized protein LOC113810667 [Penaeus vannamei]
MYECCVTEVKCAVGTTQSFPIQVGLHQGSALSPFLFAIIMDSLTKDCRRKAPWNMMFADDVVLCAREKRELEDLEQWKYAVERRGMKISSSKTEYMCLNGISTGSVEMLQRQLPETMAFTYLGSTLETDGGIGAEVNRRIQCGWNNWKKMSGILCDKSIPSKRLEVAEMKMCRWACGHTLKDHVRNEVIREKLGITHIMEQFRKARLRWFGHVKRRDEEYAGAEC